MISRLYILQAGLIAGPTKIKELFMHLQKLLLLLLLLLLQTNIMPQLLHAILMSSYDCFSLHI
jgi:hypothetical protein